MATQTTPLQIVLELDGRLISRFARLFSKGVIVSARTGCSLKDFICGQLGVAEDYLERRIQTIFLNGKAVDDYETAVVGARASLALSAAMPGLVGAVFRRGGYYAAFRDTVTHTAEESDACTRTGEVTLKLFNLTVNELGPVILTRGVVADGGDLQELFREFAEDFRKGCRNIAFNGARIPFDDLLQRLPMHGKINVSIELSQG